LSFDISHDKFHGLISFICSNDNGLYVYLPAYLYNMV
jgi:hypothetical protein